MTWFKKKKLCQTNRQKSGEGVPPEKMCCFSPFNEQWLEKPVFIRRQWRPIISVNIWRYSRDTSIFSAVGICFMPYKYVNLGFSSLRTWILDRHWRLLRFINICNLGLSPFFFWYASVGLSFPSFYSFLAVVFILVARPGAYHFHTSLSPLHLWLWSGLLLLCIQKWKVVSTVSAPPGKPLEILPDRGLWYVTSKVCWYNH